MTAAATIEALADELAEVLLRGDPFGASFMAISGYDDAVAYAKGRKPTPCTTPRI